MREKLRSTYAKVSLALTAVALILIGIGIRCNRPRGIRIPLDFKD